MDPSVIVMGYTFALCIGTWKLWASLQQHGSGSTVVRIRRGLSHTAFMLFYSLCLVTNSFCISAWKHPLGALAWMKLVLCCRWLITVLFLWETLLQMVEGNWFVTCGMSAYKEENIMLRSVPPPPTLPPGS